MSPCRAMRLVNAPPVIIHVCFVFKVSLDYLTHCISYVALTRSARLAALIPIPRHVILVALIITIMSSLSCNPIVTCVEVLCILCSILALSWSYIGISISPCKSDVCPSQNRASSQTVTRVRTVVFRLRNRPVESLSSTLEGQESSEFQEYYAFVTAFLFTSLSPR